MDGFRVDTLPPSAGASAAAELAALQATVANLERALIRRDLIGQAKGMIMAARGCDASEAFEILRVASQTRNRKLADIATEVADRSLPVSDLVATASSVG